MKGLIFTYALTYGGALVSLVNPFYGLLIYICFAIIRPQSLWFWSVPQGNYSRIIAIALLLGWALNGFGKWNLGRAKAPVLALVGYWCWAAFSTLTCENPDFGFRFLEASAKIILPVVVGVSLIESTTQLKMLAWTIVLSQGYVAYDLNMNYFDGFNRLQVSGFGGMDNNCNAIAMVSAVGLAFFLGLGERNLMKRLTAFAAAALMTHAVFFSFSRGGMLALVIVGIVSFLILPKKPAHYAFFATGVITALIMAGPEVQQRFLSAFVDAEERDESAQSRVEMWKICLDIMVAHPVAGVGPDHFPLVVHQYGRFPKGKEAHTLWLQIGAELGPLGMFALLAYYGLTCWRLMLFLRSHQVQLEEDPFICHIPQMVIASLVGFLVAAQFVSLEGLEIPYYVALLGIGALKVTASRPSIIPTLAGAPVRGPVPHPAFRTSPGFIYRDA